VCACHAEPPTIWKILRLFGCIAQDLRRKPHPLQRKPPGEEVQLDLKDATTVPADAEGKRKPGGGNYQCAWMRAPPSG
jgi:hypothetical protein